MNEVKELVEELRNKKSRDNRELLDRSADMIEKLAKELCEKSGCHHKCHDTKDCVVEDEALLLINENKSNNFDVKSNNEIEEMAKIVLQEPHIGGLYGFDERIASRLYNAGYRKQGWISVEDRLPERNGRYLTHCDIEGQSLVCVLYYCKVGGFNEGTVTHWMPLPEAPKMKGENI